MSPLFRGWIAVRTLPIYTVRPRSQLLTNSEPILGFPTTRTGPVSHPAEHPGLLVLGCVLPGKGTPRSDFEQARISALGTTYNRWAGLLGRGIVLER